MPAIISFFFRTLINLIPSMALTALKGMGFYLVAFTGLHLMIDQAKELIFQNLSSIPGTWMAALGLLKIDVCVNIIMSAHVAKLLRKGLDKKNDKMYTAGRGPVITPSSYGND